jgi:zinc transporter, ZIP family
MVPTLLIVLYSLIPAVLAVIGGLIASAYVPKPKLISGLQHFVAGVVIAAVSIELLPEITKTGARWTIGLGFVIGVGVMIALHELAHAIADKEAKRGIPIGLIAGGAIDLLIDGILIGVSFLAGIQSGILIAASLSLCAFFLNLTISSTMTANKAGKGLQVFFIFLIAAMLPIGAFIGAAIISHFSSTILVETIAFGVAALLYLGVEELLSQAHEEHDTAWTQAAFFLGFLLIILFKL